MKASRGSFSPIGLVCLRTALALLVGFSLLAITPSRMPLNAPPMSFAAALRQMELLGFMHDGENAVALLGLVLITAFIVLYSTIRSRVGRLGIILLLLAPTLAAGDLILRLPGRAIAGAFRAVSGQGNGQFYGDGPFFMAVLGLWIIFCLLLLCREGGHWWCTRKSAEPGAPGNAGERVG